MWQERHEEIEAQREEIRQRVRKTRDIKGELRAAKPKPTITDSSDKKVAVYARVSTSSLDQTSSIENQSMYYEKKIADTPNWELQEIYSDEGKSGTSTKHRDEFNRMMKDAQEKKMDIIICASVSRFARNMSDCMTYVRMLKSMNPSHPVGVYFETENIYTLDPDSGQSLSVHAMLADWESANKSRRMILSYDQRISTGQYPVADLLGYRHTKDGDLIIEPEEAKTVRFIYLSFIIGKDFGEIADKLTDMKRTTLRGRTDWNPAMVKNIMQNERRWGDLEARKTIVIDYVEHKSKRNNEDRISAYSHGHHEGIVTPEIAAASKMISESGRAFNGGVPDSIVIDSGALKGFVSVSPAWAGLNNRAFQTISRSVYDDNEYNDLIGYQAIKHGEEHSQILSFQMSGYQVPPGIMFLNKSMAALTITNNALKFSSACLKKLNYCEYIEILYHPILQMLAIRASQADYANSVQWSKDGTIINKISASGFASAVYEGMDWKREYSFKFRGVTKVRGCGTIILFSLDEPQIIPGKRRKRMNNNEQDLNDPIYIEYTNSECRGIVDVFAEGCTAYPKEWDNAAFGLNYSIRKKKEDAIRAITEDDILSPGIRVENPNIGHIPSRDEILSELEELLLSM